MSAFGNVNNKYMHDNILVYDYLFLAMSTYTSSGYDPTTQSSMTTYAPTMYISVQYTMWLF